VVAFAQGDWSTVSWSPVVRVLEAQKSSARQRTLATSENELTDQEAADAQGNEGQIQGLWACDGGLPDALAIVVLRAHGRPNPRPPDRGGGGAVGFGNVMWQIQLKVDSVHAPASAASDARGGTGLHVIGGKVRLWDDVPPSALSGGGAVAVAPNLVVSMAEAGPWVAARVLSFPAAVAAAQSSARASSAPSSPALQAGEAGSWERRLLARPVGVAIKSAASGASVPVAMSGAVDIFDRLVPGCRYVVEPDGSLQCGEIPSSDGGLKASDIGFQSVSYPLGLAVSGSVMVLGGPMPASR